MTHPGVRRGKGYCHAVHCDHPCYVRFCSPSDVSAVAPYTGVYGPDFWRVLSRARPQTYFRALECCWKLLHALFKSVQY